jgi:hypothetical protein
MISMVKTSKGKDAITSDRWHVVHSRFVTDKAPVLFLRSISSEHDDRATCVAAARTLLVRVRRDCKGVPVAERDQVFVRRPGFKSFKAAKHRFERTRGAEGGDGA